MRLLFKTCIYNSLKPHTVQVYDENNERKQKIYIELKDQNLRTILWIYDV